MATTVDKAPKEANLSTKAILCPKQHGLWREVPLQKEGKRDEVQNSLPDHQRHKNKKEDIFSY